VHKCPALGDRIETLIAADKRGDQLNDVFYGFGALPNDMPTRMPIAGVEHEQVRSQDVTSGKVDLIWRCARAQRRRIGVGRVRSDDTE